jgi:glycosyltransferase involved in cell wall biosynthesis
MQLLSLIIPAYNERGRIQTTIGEALDYFRSKGLACEIIVSADGTDGTREAARTLAERHNEIKVIGQPERRGKGRGIREAVRLASGDVIGFVDADNKTPITEFDRVEELLRAGHDVVIGSRALPGSRIEKAQPLYRQLGSRGFGLFMHACVGLDQIVDTQCGFKFFRGHVARDLFRLQQIDGYMFDVEILYLAQQLGYRVSEVPVRWRDDGDSRLQLLSGNLRNFCDVVSIRWRHRDVAAARLDEDAVRETSRL